MQSNSKIKKKLNMKSEKNQPQIFILKILNLLKKEENEQETKKKKIEV